ncbi:MAG TPA: alpha-N-arabinofuranosidase [Lacisediminihabitans sp.]|uniref:arabinosylfuranosidase ArfA n=1 Tax=Lacisediminihabitans sp. TaxID=2787631 RepID=UPI002EDAF38C
MSTARIVVHDAYLIGDVDRRLFGSFVEHMGRAVYGGIYEPGHATADEHGFRTDVLRLVKELGPTMVRYPGGNFVSAYNWEDGVGPVEDRPVRLDLAWRSRETNRVGLAEFAAWSENADVELMMAVNLGTRGVDAARNLVEYCNHPGGTYWSDLRRSHGVADPYGIKIWCLGNEMDAPWQIGHKTAVEYGRIALESAKAMRRVDPGIELVACGSSNRWMPTFGEWEATVLEETYEQVDYISLHNYYEDVDGDAASFLASSDSMDDFITSVVATADHIKGKLHSRKSIQLSFDEWNVWHQTEFHSHDGSREAWREAPDLAEDVYTVTEAVVVGSLLISLLNHADRVRMACIAQLVNVIAPITTVEGGAAWRQTTFFPFADVAARAGGVALRLDIDAGRHETAKYGEVDDVVAAATWDEGTGEIVIFAANRSLDRTVELDLVLGGRFEGYRAMAHRVLTHDDRDAANTADRMENVTPRTVSVTDSVAFPPVSWNVVTLRRA